MRPSGLVVAFLSACALAAPAAAQFSDSYQFLKAVRERDGGKVTDLVNESGASIINAKEATTGDSALHITVRDRNTPFLRFLIGKGASTATRNADGATPLVIAIQIGNPEAADALIGAGADVNLANGRGETPLIVAVQRRDIAAVRTLLAAGADPKRADRIAGRTARDYAAQDTRTPILLKIIDEAKPAKPKAGVSGPVF